MYCQNCGAQNVNDASFCTGCGSPIHNNDSVSAVSKSTNQTNVDEAGIGVIILSALIPIIGLVLYFNWKNNFPNKSKNIIIAAGVGFVINIFLLLIQ